MNLKRSWRRLSRGPWVTYAFLAACVLVFIATFFVSQRLSEPWTTSLVRMGAKFDLPMVFNGEWWRLFTAIFLHADVQHIAMNSVSFYFLGMELEPLLGRWRFLLLALGAGIGGNVLSFAFSDSISVGASGAVFGLFACYLGLAYLYPDAQGLRARAQNYLALILVNLLISLSPGIDLWAHLGGVLYGLVLTYVLQLPHSTRRTRGQRVLALVGLLIVTGVMIYLGITRTQAIFRMR